MCGEGGCLESKDTNLLLSFVWMSWKGIRNEQTTNTRSYYILKPKCKFAWCLFKSAEMTLFMGFDLAHQHCHSISHNSPKRSCDVAGGSALSHRKNRAWTNTQTLPSLNWTIFFFTKICTVTYKNHLYIYTGEDSWFTNCTSNDKQQMNMTNPNVHE